MNGDEIVSVPVDRAGKIRRSFWNLARLQPSKVTEGPQGIEVTWAKGTPRERVTEYTAIPRARWKDVEVGEDYFLEDGAEVYFSAPPTGVVWFEGCLFRRGASTRIGSGR